MPLDFKRIFCGQDGWWCSIGCQARGEHRDWALSIPWKLVQPRDMADAAGAANSQASPE